MHALSTLGLFDAIFSRDVIGDAKIPSLALNGQFRLDLELKVDFYTVDQENLWSPALKSTLASTEPVGTVN